jgi:hypothetical protein
MKQPPITRKLARTRGLERLVWSVYLEHMIHLGGLNSNHHLMHGMAGKPDRLMWGSVKNKAA